MSRKENSALGSLERRESACWAMAEVFLENKDPHGIHDMGVEIQALQRAKSEIKQLVKRVHRMKKLALLTLMLFPSVSLAHGERYRSNNDVAIIVGSVLGAAALANQYSYYPYRYAPPPPPPPPPPPYYYYNYSMPPYYYYYPYNLR